jgi:hypothetical protein
MRRASSLLSNFAAERRRSRNDMVGVIRPLARRGEIAREQWAPRSTPVAEGDIRRDPPRLITRQKLGR